MARNQYRLSGQLLWQSSSGNAIVAIMNPSGSGRKLTFHGFAVEPLAAGGAVAVTWGNTNDRGKYRLGRGTVTGGELVTPLKLDTDASAWPSTVRVVTRACVTSPEVPLRTVSTRLTLLPSATVFPMAARQKPDPTLLGSFFRKRKDADVEGLVVRAGEAIALYPGADPEFRRTTPLRVCATLVRSGTPKRTYTVEYLTYVTTNNGAVFAIDNASGSGETITLRDIGISEVGDTSTPYFQIVPVGSVVEQQSTDAFDVVAMDSTSPDPSAWITVYADAAILPFGLPENALADSSGGTPKGFNYLKTKDFLGPVYRTIFPEGVVAMVGGGTIAPDTFAGPRHWLHDPFMRKSGITVRPGEGIALVSAAETATGSAQVGRSGWSPYMLDVVVDIEPESVPSIGISGMVEDSRWRVERVSDNSLVATGVADATGATSFDYTDEDFPLDLRLRVRKASAVPLYKPVELEFNLTSAGASIPVSQVSDA